MKKTAVVITLIMALGILTGCAGNQGLIKPMSTSTRQDVFQDYSAATPIPPGYACLRISSSLKTHLPGIYSEKDIHGTPEYKLLVNIDGQAVQLVGSLREERREPHPLHDPEAGHGMRYHFQTELHLKSGMHKIFISLPFDDVAVNREIDLTAEKCNILLLDPVYRLARDKQRIGFYTHTSFQGGIRGFRMIYNGKNL